MKKDLNISIKELTRVEGHGNISIDVKKGRVKEARFSIIESPRFFEVMLKGRRYDEAHHIMSRICGICAVSHTSASLKAIEDATGMSLSVQTRLLRRLAFAGEVMQSHILHLFFLVFPDILGRGSIAPLLESHPGLVKNGLELKKLANEVCAVVGGRHIHPISLVPGGSAHTPSAKELKGLKKRLEASFGPLGETIEFMASHNPPEYSRARELLALKKRGEYGLYDGTPTSSDKYTIEPESYIKKIKEYVVPWSAAKYARGPRGTFMVGAIARVSNNFRQLSPRAREAARRIGLKPPLRNPFLNNTAQLIECFHLAEEATGLIDRLLSSGPTPERVKRPRRFGRGIGIVEAPRGTLYHDYTVGEDGIIKRAECVIPTAQNLRSVEEDLRAFVPTIMDRPREEIRASVESMVRAYDPCISCSTHLMEVRFE